MGAVIRHVGMDVHAETIAVAVAEADGEVHSLGVFPNRDEYIARIVKKLGGAEGLRVCYEAGPCGYVLYWQLTRLGVHCDVVAPTLIPVRAGDRVKTDRKDALKLARLYRAGELTTVWVPDEGHEALRDLIRAREAAKQDQLRARHRLSKFLLRRGLRAPDGTKKWTQKYRIWLATLRFEHFSHASTFEDYLHETDHVGERITRLEVKIDEAVDKAPAQIREVIAGLQALRGVAKLTGATIVAEVGKLSRFGKANQLMGYAGIVSSEHSSGGSTRRGGITKTGNAHLRRVLVEAAIHYRLRPHRGPEIKKRQEGLPEGIKEKAWKAQNRLHKRYTQLRAKGKDHRKAVTAVARELLGFIWSIGSDIERAQASKEVAA